MLIFGIALPFALSWFAAKFVCLKLKGIFGAILAWILGIFAGLISPMGYGFLTDYFPNFEFDAGTFMQCFVNAFLVSAFLAAPYSIWRTRKQMRSE